MSANPEAFAYLRTSAYGYAQQHGNNEQALIQHCRDALDTWLCGDGADSDLHVREAEALVKTVASWVSNHYHRPKRKALRRRDERAAIAVAAPVHLEYAAEDGLKPSIRNAARISGQSKSTLARHLRLQGISPVRDRRINALPATVKRIARILDFSFPTDGAWLVQVDHCIAKIWDDLDVLPEAMPRSTKSERRKKLPELLAAITAAGIGFNILVHSNVIAIRRGRRFKGLKDTAVWIEEEERINGFKLLRSAGVGSRKKSYWDDPWLSDVLAVLYTGAAHRTLSDASQLDPWLRLLRPLLDPRPLIAVIDTAVRHAMQDDIVRDLQGLGAGVTDGEVKRAVYRLAGAIGTIQLYAEHGSEPVDFFDDVDRECRFMAYLANSAPKSYAKVAYFRSVVLPKVAASYEEDPDPIHATLTRCRALRDEEREGTWTAPSANELAAFLPPKE